MPNILFETQQQAEQRKYSVPLILTFATTGLLLIANEAFRDFFMQSSIQLSLGLQKVRLEGISFIFSYVILGLLVLHILVLYTVKKDHEQSIVMILNLFVALYFQGILKLLYVDDRPVFLSEDLNSRFCNCDYGQPSGHSLMSACVLMIIYDDLVKTFPLSRWAKGFVGFGFSVIALSVGVSRIYYGVHSYNQVILGFGFGTCLFLLTKLLDGPIKQNLLGPALHKSQYVSLAQLKRVFIVFAASNVLLLALWAIRFWVYESLPGRFSEFRNCFDCLKELQTNFSTKIYSEALPFNFMFGMLVGIYMIQAPTYKFEGLFYDRSPRRFAARLIMFVGFLSPLALIKVPPSSSTAITILRSVVLSLVVGYLIGHVFPIVMARLTDEEDYLTKKLHEVAAKGDKDLGLLDSGPRETLLL